MTIRSGCLSALFLSFLSGAAPGAELDLSVVDESGRSLPCRVQVRPHGGESVVPESATVLRLAGDRWFMSPGRNRLTVPEGKVLLRIERGLEYARHKETVEIGAAETRHTVTLRRWIDMKRRGYLCGENHLHVDTKTLAPMLVAEGLDFGSSLSWWNGPDDRRPPPQGEGHVRDLEFAGEKVPTSVYDAELEYGWGAAYIQALPAPMPLKTDRARPNLDYVKHAAEAGAIVHYQGGWSREVLLDALLGYVHVVNVCNNNFGLHRFQPRSRYSNLLGVEGFPVYPDTDTGMMRMNIHTYYRLLNCGLRLAAGAGSATGVKQAPVGYNRVYVRVAPDATLARFNEAWKAGRNFVTNGPMLFLETADGQRPGDTIEGPASGATVRVSVEALSCETLTAVQVIVNGEVAASLETDDPRKVKKTVVLKIEEGSWIAARCTERDRRLTDAELAVYRSGNDADRMRTRPSRLRFAHTSPIYVTVGGRGAAVRESIEEGLRMLDQFEMFARRTAGPDHTDSILSAVRQAREKLQVTLRAR